MSLSPCVFIWESRLYARQLRGKFPVLVRRGQNLYKRGQAVEGGRGLPGRGRGRGRGPRAWAGPGGRLRAAAGRRATSSRGGEPGSRSSREKGWLGPRRVDEARPSSAGPVRGNKAHLGVVASVFVLNFQRQGTFFSGGSNSCIKWIFISMYLVLNQGFSMSQRVLSKVP